MPGPTAGRPTGRLPDVSRLRLLREVANHGSLAAAARALGTTASAASQQLAVLEREAGVTLVDRGPTGATLTGAGQLLAEDARAVLRQLERTRATMDQLGGVAAGTVRVGAIASAASAVVLPADERLTGSGIELAVTVCEPTRSIADVLSGRLDVAIIDIYDHVPLALPDHLAMTEILAEPLVLVTPPDQPPPGDLADLADADWILPPDNAACGAATRYACRSAGFEPNVHWETDDLLLLVVAVARGRGVTLLPRLAIADDVADVALHDVPRLSLHRRIVAVARTSAAARPVVRTVLDELSSVLDELPSVLDELPSVLDELPSVLDEVSSDAR